MRGGWRASSDLERQDEKRTRWRLAWRRQRRRRRFGSEKEKKGDEKKEKRKERAVDVGYEEELRETLRRLSFARYGEGVVGLLLEISENVTLKRSKEPTSTEKKKS